MSKSKYISDEQFLLIAKFIKENKINQSELARTMRYSVQRINVIINSAFKEKKEKVKEDLAKLLLDTSEQMLKEKIAKIIFLKSYEKKAIEKLDQDQEAVSIALKNLNDCRGYTTQA